MLLLSLLQDWGKYSIDNLKILSHKVDLENTSVNTNRAINVQLGGIGLTFDVATFKIDKHSFPKVKDTGTASCEGSCAASIAFDLWTDGPYGVQIKNVKPVIKVQELQIKVLSSGSSKLKLLYNVMIKMFRERIQVRPSDSATYELIHTILYHQVAPHRQPQYETGRPFSNSLPGMKLWRKTREGGTTHCLDAHQDHVPPSCLSCLL